MATAVASASLRLDAGIRPDGRVAGGFCKKAANCPTVVFEARFPSGATPCRKAASVCCERASSGSCPRRMAGHAADRVVKLAAFRRHGFVVFHRARVRLALEGNQKIRQRFGGSRFPPAARSRAARPAWWSPVARFVDRSGTPGATAGQLHLFGTQHRRSFGIEPRLHGLRCAVASQAIQLAQENLALVKASTARGHPADQNQGGSQRHTEPGGRSAKHEEEEKLPLTSPR